MTEPSPLPRSPQSSATAPSAPPSPPSAGGGWTDVLLAVVFYLLLTDTAAETFLGGSSGRWWVVGAAAVYLSLTGLVWRMAPGVWRRLTWSPLATMTLAVLVGVLVLPTWLTGGFDAGVRAAGQPTSMLLSAFTVAAVVMAAFILLRQRVLPLIARWVGGALGAYAVAALVLGIVRHTAYSDLFRGSSFWGRLPAALQGAFVGAFLLIPFALLAALVESVVRLRRHQSARRVVQQVVALALSFLMALSGLTISGGSHATASSETSGSAPRPAASGDPQLASGDIAASLERSSAEFRAALAGPRPPGGFSRAQLAERLEGLFPIVEAAERDLPRDTFDVRAVIDQVGREPAKLFEWVRDHTDWVPYQGSLRGPTGVLMDRLGNSLDRALLLAELLRAAGRTARLRHTPLSEDLARSLLPRIRPARSDRPPVSVALSDRRRDQLLNQIALRYQADPSELHKRYEAAVAESDQLANAVSTRAAAQASLIVAAGIRKPERPIADASASLQQALRDHWVVQVQDADSWTDLDPLLPDSQPGRALAAVAETMDPARLDGRVFHEVQIQIVIERWQDGRVEEQRVLSHVLRPSALFGQRIVVRHVPLAWPDVGELLSADDAPQRLKAAALATREWLPVISVGKSSTSHLSFSDQGQTKSSPGSGLGPAGVGGTVGGLLGGFGGEPENTDHSQLTAEWIDYEFRSPGEPVRTIRREVFDLLGPAARSAAKIPAPTLDDRARLARSLALLGETEILPLVCNLSPEFIDDLMATALLANRGILPGLLRDGDWSHSKSLDALVPIPGALYRLALARQAWSRFQRDVYIDRPNVLSSHQYFEEDESGRISSAAAFDIVANTIAVQRSATADPFLLRLEQGVADTNAEAVLVAPRGPAMAGAQLLTSGATRGTEWVLISREEDVASLKVPMRRDVQIRIQQDLRAGFVVLLPSPAIRADGLLQVAWWRVDSRSGETLGIGDRGWGQTDVEYAHVTVSGMHYGVCLVEVGNKESLLVRQKLGLMIFCLLGAGFAIAGPMGVIVRHQGLSYVIGNLLMLVAERQEGER